VASWQLLVGACAVYPGYNEMQVATSVHLGLRPDLNALARTVPAPLADLLVRCLHADPAARPRSGAELLELLPKLGLQACCPPPPGLAAAGVGTLGGSGLQAVEAVWRHGGLVLAECACCREANQPGLSLLCGALDSEGAPHATCLPCALRALREARSTDLAVRCLICASQGVFGVLADAAVGELAAWSRVPGRCGAVDSLRPMSAEERDRLLQALSEARDRDLAAREAALARTFKCCPYCGYALTHARGHGCHHITPGSGCPGCAKHFCYACLGPWPCTKGCPYSC
jgi:hypothetical protein